MTELAALRMGLREQPQAVAERTERIISEPDKIVARGGPPKWNFKVFGTETGTPTHL